MSETPTGSSGGIMSSPDRLLIARRHSKALASRRLLDGRGAPPSRAATPCNSVQPVPRNP